MNKQKILDYLYNQVDLSKYRYNLLNCVQRLEYLRDNVHYVSPNYKGQNYLLIFLNIDNKNVSCLIDRKKLSYHRTQLDMITIQITNIPLSCDSVLYNGTIFDGKLIQNNSENIFLIQDCFYCMNKSMLEMDMISKLQEIDSIINSYINKNSCNKFKLKINTLSNYDNLENIINTLEKCSLPTNGLIFYPQKSGINILYIEKKIVEKITNNDNIIIKNHTYDLINNYVEFLKSRTYSYEHQIPKGVGLDSMTSSLNNQLGISESQVNNLNKIKSQILWLSKTIIPDVYDISMTENSNKIGIALIPNLKISYMCDNLINDKSVPFNCNFSQKFKKWIPISPYEK
jgi:hypothetical protein